MPLDCEIWNYFIQHFPCGGGGTTTPPVLLCLRPNLNGYLDYHIGPQIRISGSFTVHSITILADHKQNDVKYETINNSKPSMVHI